MVSTFTTTVKRALGVVTIAAFLGGCATAVQRQYQAMASNNQSAVQDLQACTVAVYHDGHSTEVPNNIVPMSGGCPGSGKSHPAAAPRYLPGMLSGNCGPSVAPQVEQHVQQVAEQHLGLAGALRWRDRGGNVIDDIVVASG